MYVCMWLCKFLGLLLYFVLFWLFDLFAFSKNKKQQQKKPHEVGRIERKRGSEKKNHDQNAMYEKLFLTEILALVYMYKIYFLPV